MTKREEIRKGIKEKLLFDMKLVSPMVSKELEYNVNQLAGEIVQYLHSQLPSIFDNDENVISALEYKKKLDDLFEPLVKEET